MISSMTKVAAAAAFLTGLLFAQGFAAAVAQSAPIETGACCHLIQGCCDAPVELQAETEGGVGGGQCRISAMVNCNGILDEYKGDGTTCEEFCSTPTTTLPVTGACCNVFDGCCPAPSKLGDAGLTGVGGAGECRASDPFDCVGIADTYKGDGTTCEEFCPVSTTTTTLPTGACCEPLGTCLDVIDANCVIGDYQGDGTECATVECTQPTTTTVPDTTTTTEYIPPTTTVPDTTTTTEPLVVLCGDANGDGDITAVDALVALRTAVDIGNCPETRCDYNGNGEVQSSDALAILRVSVGQFVVPMCPLL
jgi:hypothetical protein